MAIDRAGRVGQVAVLAGGLATRMRPATESLPKYLLEVAGRPFADHQLAWLADAGVEEVLLLIGHRGEAIREHVGDGERFGLRVAYVDEGEDLRGTAGALRLAAEEGLLASEFAVLYGDSYLPIDIAAVWEDFRARRAEALMCTLRNEGRWDSSNAVVRDGRVVRYEKGVADPAAEGIDRIDYGLSLLRRDLIEELVPAAAVADLAALYGELAAGGRLAAHDVGERFYEIGSPEGIAELDAYLREGDDGRPREVELLTPPGEDAEREIELSIVIPALDEELTISEFVGWCHEGLERAGVAGEILIVDSSADRTSELALAAGARVLRVPKRGLGRAYIDALPFIRGRWVLMGDCDCTYDFRRLDVFVERFRAGDEFVMGSRWKGSIEPGSMPWLHQHLGTPVTTFILNRLYGSSFSDIHCGMRGITRDALAEMDLRSQSWEYASEMVLKSVHMELRTAEVPVTFLKDKEGRLSHHKRSGWFSPWQAAWINLRAMFVYGADFFVFKPGAFLAILGLLIVLPTSFGDLDLGALTLSLNWQFFGLTLLVVGLQGFFLGCIAQVLFDYTGRHSRRWLRAFPYTRSTLLAFALVLAGLALGLPLVVEYLSSDFRLAAADSTQNHLAVTGLAAVVCGAQLFVFTLLLHGTMAATAGSRPRTLGGRR